MTRTTLSDADGVVGRYDRTEHDGHAYADLFDREPERAARAVVAELRCPATRRGTARG